MNTTENEILNVASQVAPEAPVVEAAEAAVTTIADPSVLNIVSDLELAHTLILEFKEKMAGLHPTVANIFKALF